MRAPEVLISLQVKFSSIDLSIRPARRYAGQATSSCLHAANANLVTITSIAAALPLLYRACRAGQAGVAVVMGAAYDADAFTRGLE